MLLSDVVVCKVVPRTVQSNHTRVSAGMNSNRKCVRWRQEGRPEREHRLKLVICLVSISHPAGALLYRISHGVGEEQFRNQCLLLGPWLDSQCKSASVQLQECTHTHNSQNTPCYVTLNSRCMSHYCRTYDMHANRLTYQDVGVSRINGTELNWREHEEWQWEWGIDPTWVIMNTALISSRNLCRFTFKKSLKQKLVNLL